MENTQENKARFFALYYGQAIAKAYDEDSLSKIGGIYDINHMIATDYYLSLRSIASLTELECTEIAKMASIFKSDHTADFGASVVNFIRFKRMYDVINLHCTTWAHIHDYLRSISVLIPFMGLSVEGIINRGWAKLREEKE